MPGGADDHLMAPRRVRKQASISAKPVTFFTSYSRSKRPETGSQPRVREKKRVRSRASQKTGIEKPTSATAADQGIGPFIAHYAGDHPHRNAYQQGKAEGEDAQLHGRREHLAQLLRNQLAVNAGDAEIPVQHPFKPEQPRIPQGSALQWGMRGGNKLRLKPTKVRKKRVISSSSRRRRVKIIMASSPLRYFPAIRQRTKRYRKG